MRTAALTLFSFVAFSLATNAQRFSLLPQVGFENSKTTIRYNGLGSFSPQGVKFSPQGSLRLNYASKKGHGFFVGVASSRSTVSFSFTDPERGMTDFISNTGNMQLRMEGGYQFNSKPVLFKSAGSKTGSSAKKSCGRSGDDRGQCIRSNASSHHCCASKTNSNKSSQAKNKGSWVRIQSSIGMGFIPSVQTNVISKTSNGLTVHEYHAGNWNTALIAGTGFEFGRSKNRLFTVSINYFKGIGNLDRQTITSVSGTKSVTTTLQSAASGWNMRVGIPFSLAPKMPSKVRKQQKGGCMQYRIMYRCSH